MSEWSYIWAAYGLTWVVFAGYAVFLANKVRGARRRLDRLANARERGR